MEPDAGLSGGIPRAVHHDNRADFYERNLPMTEAARTDHLLLLQGVADGYPLPRQHPANDLYQDGRFERAFSEAAAADTLRVTRTNKLVLTNAGRAALASESQS
jgi:hypothetical protein